MSEITGGELCARALEADGIEFLFRLPSPEIDPLLFAPSGLRNCRNPCRPDNHGAEKT
jgi:acetolactate synthase-1/2/3 large subunit